MHSIPHSRPLLDEDERDEVLATIQQSWVGADGDVSEAFSGELAVRLGRPTAVPVSSGTAALEIALRVVGVHGRQVAMPVYSCPSIQRAIIRAGGIPHRVDSDLDDLSFAAADLVPATANCAAVVLVHQFGLPAACSDAISQLSVPVVEDLTTALGAKLGGREVGRYGRLAILSMAATKLICVGEGGAIAGEPADVKLARKWSDPESDLPSEEPVSNAKLSAMACAMGRAQLRKLPRLLERRTRIAAHYDDVLGSAAERVVRPRDGDEATWWRYLIRVSPSDPAAVVERANARGVAFRRPIPERSWATEGRFPVADQLHRELVSVPLHPSLTDSEVDRVSETIREVVLTSRP